MVRFLAQLAWKGRFLQSTCKQGQAVPKTRTREYMLGWDAGTVSTTPEGSPTLDSRPGTKERTWQGAAQSQGSKWLLRTTQFSGLKLNVPDQAQNPPP